MIEDADYTFAVQSVILSRSCSTSRLSHQLRVSWRAANLMMERMAAEGVVSDVDRRGGRRVLDPPRLTTADTDATRSGHPL